MRQERQAEIGIGADSVESALGDGGYVVDRIGAQVCEFL
jgi:hypothetical protein